MKSDAKVSNKFLQFGEKGPKYNMTGPFFQTDQHHPGCGDMPCVSMPILLFGKGKVYDDLRIDDPGVDHPRKLVEVMDPHRHKKVFVDARLGPVAAAILQLFKLEKCFLNHGRKIVSLVFSEGPHGAMFCRICENTIADESTGQWAAGSIFKKVEDPGQIRPRLEVHSCVDFPLKDMDSVVRLMQLVKETGEMPKQ